jgi:hypothetical protein
MGSLVKEKVLGWVLRNLPSLDWVVGCLLLLWLLLLQVRL